MIFAGWFHYHKAAPKLAWFQDVESMLNHHLAGLLGLGSLSWAGHQIHVSLPINQFLDAGVDPKEIPLPHEFILNRDLLAQLYPSFAEGTTPFFTLNWSKYAEFLTFPIAILFLIAGHMYRTNWGIGHGLKDILEAHKGPFTGQGHKGLYEILTTSWHAQLSLNLAMLGSLTIVVVHHIYAMLPYPYLATDYVGVAAHATIFMVRDYDPTTRYNDLLDRVLRHRDTIISHLNWACIFLGFHSFGLYIHNDTMSALGRPQDMFLDIAIQLQPVFAQWVQNTHACLTWWGSGLIAVGGKVALLPIPLGTTDFLVHHIHAFTIHVTILILLKGVLFARSSRLIPDQANLGFCFPCDEPGRGGDHVFLGLFWMYNAISVVIFHFSWKMQSDVWGSINDQGVVTHITGGNFARDLMVLHYLHMVFFFLGAHFVWAFSLMFLFSGRGYWQELIESIVWAHNKLKVAPATHPKALSIVQGRVVGVTHYLLGGIATTWANVFIEYFCFSLRAVSNNFSLDFLNLFHVAWQGNFESWVKDPLHVRPIAHAIWDPHFGQPAVEAFTRQGALGPVNIAYSGVYQWWLFFLLFLSAISLIAGWLHMQPKSKPSVSWFKNAESRLNHHLSGLFGVSSLAWTGHLVHVAIPDPGGLGPLFTGQWNLYAQNPDYDSHLFGTAQGAGTIILTLLGGFHPQTQSFWLTDMAHHHLAFAFIFLVAGHMYRTNFGIGHSMKDLLEAHIPPGGRLGCGHKGLYDTINNSIHFQLGLALASLGVITSLVAQHMYSLPAYAFIEQDFTTQAALYTHHQYIAGFIMTGAFAHGAIFFIRDYNPEQNEDNVLERMLDHKAAIKSHLSWVSLFSGVPYFGTLCS
ncbi:hypothetical protein MKW92_003103 [Papaver armeniacum]|nr:hypothetical protein MKW92_003103 [Papaver armeniacum]